MEEFNTTPVKHKTLSAALLAIQMEIQNPVKNARNPHLKNTYADFNAVNEAVKPIYNRHGVLIKQPQILLDGKSYINTKLVHVDSGEVDDECLTEVIFNAGNPQAQGSGISYARRYGLQTVAGTGSDDDDGEKAKGRQQQQPNLPPQQTPPNKESKTRTPIQAKLAACKTLEALTEVWEGLTPEEKEFNKESAGAVKKAIKAKLDKEQSQNNNNGK